MKEQMHKFASSFIRPPSALFRRPSSLFSESAATVGERSKATMATLLSTHLLGDGEVVLLILKPSLWFVLLSSLRFIAAVLILIIGLRIYDQAVTASARTYLEIGSFLIFGRLTWATLQWMGRLYVLTDMRILRLSGVFTIDAYECPLRRIARTRIVRTSRERVVGVGSIEIIPQDEERAIDTWQIVARPKEVHETIVAAINRAKQHPFCDK
jgi:hypothetical protein